MPQTRGRLKNATFVTDGAFVVGSVVAGLAGAGFAATGSGIGEGLGMGAPYTVVNRNLGQWAKRRVDPYQGQIDPR